MLLCISCAPAPEPVLWEDLLDALDAVTPLVEDAGPGLAFLEMRGIAGTPVTWIASVRAILQSFELCAAIGIARNRIGARAAAFTGDGTVCQPGGERKLLAPLPVALLQIGDDVLERLRLLGIELLGDLAALPHGPFVRRFGPAAARWHELARGIDDEPFLARGHAVAIEAALLGEGRAEDEAQVFFAVRALLAQICADLERCGKRAGALRMEVELEDSQMRSFDVPMATPSAQERMMLDLLRAKLEGVTFPAAIVGLRIRAMRLEEGGEPLTLFASGDFDAQAIAVAVARLEAMLGEPVRCARVQPAHVLEERFAYDVFDVTRVTAQCVEAPYVTPSSSKSDSPSFVPQLRLLAVSEIEVVVRGGEPAFVGTPAQAVIRCAGPWRIEIGWFSEASVERDEYDVLLEDGELYRIYRQGEHWYVRGAYD